LLIKIVKIFLHPDLATAKSFKHKPINKYSVMPEQENVSIEKLSLGRDDFAEDLDNSFGIQDTQVLASRDLENFLLSDPDQIKSLEEERKKEEEQRQQQAAAQQEEGKEKPKPTDKKQPVEKPDGKDALEKLLFNDGEEEETPPGAGNDTPGKPNNAEDDDTYKTLSADLLRLGVFTKNSEEESEENISIKTPEEFLERFGLEKKKGAINILDNFLSQFGDEYRSMFDAVFVKGVKPQDYLSSFSKIEAIKDLDLTQESNQERIVKAYYKGLKWDDAKIEARISKLKDYGDLADEATTYHEVLLNKEKETAESLERQKTEETQRTKEKEVTTKKAYQRILAEKLKNLDFDGIPLTEKEAEEALQYLTDKKYKLASGELLAEFDKDVMELNRPENHEIKLKMGLLLRKKLDLTPIKKATISKKSDALFTLSTKNAKEKQSREKEVKSFF
jgi:hypothetical protein